MADISQLNYNSLDINLFKNIWRVGDLKFSIFLYVLLVFVQNQLILTVNKKLKPNPNHCLCRSLTACCERDRLNMSVLFHHRFIVFITNKTRHDNHTSRRIFPITFQPNKHRLCDTSLGAISNPYYTFLV